ncbi:GTPase SAR1 family protein [Anoxybacillus mongoliensis]|uniref:GTPase SAR1 family protein n=1 Tax=Anoxybacillus mongoliensis TaxID=452565 RepID=A0A7W8JGS5_9BACL|nr:dynamin family protein [Anoxybacillus mongoliensis]MBB5356765.1 GTPase SAR1 family protein [Anoxybacillus mongoliensis]
MIQKFIEKRNRIIELIEEVKNSNYFSDEVITESGINKSLANLKSGAFKVALIAPFSAGKSTFINGLIGEDLLSRNILAETATITTLKYGKENKIKVYYYDGTEEEYPGINDTQVTFEDLKRFLKEKTTVTRVESEEEFVVRVEDSVRAVDVFWDVDLLKDGVEIIDTPGLYSSYKEHKDITERILTEAHAILFLISPDSVGEVHFTEFISNYVENAKRSNLDAEGKHIFFVITKIDRFKKEEIQHAREELLKVLQPILPNPQILEVSSYFAMKSRMYEKGRFSLQELQSDRDILFIDEETGYPVAGPLLTEDKVPLIKEVSQIEKVEKTLADYLEYKNNYLIDEVISLTLSMFEREQEELQQRIQMLENNFKNEEVNYQQKLESLQRDFARDVEELKQKTEKRVIEEFEYNERGQSPIVNLVKEIRKYETPILTEQVKIQSMKAWQARKNELNQYNGKRIMQEIIDILKINIQTAKKTFIQKVFQQLERRYTKSMEEFIGAFKDFEKEVLDNFVKELDLQPIENHSSFFNKEQVLNEVRNEVEKFYKETALECSPAINERIDDLINENTSYRRKPGLLNAIKSFFGKAEMIKEFNQYRYQQDFRQLVDEVTDESLEVLRMEVTEIEFAIEEKIRLINDKVKKGLKEKIDHFQKWKTRNMKQLEEELSIKKEDMEEAISAIEQKVSSLSLKYEEVRQKYLDILVLEEGDISEVQSVS